MPVQITDDRQNYSSDVRTSRLNNQSIPALNPSSGKMDDATRVFAVKGFAELDQIALDYGELLETGNLALMLDNTNLPVKLLAWINKTDKWKEIPNVSVAGPVLAEASTGIKGIVSFATNNESSALKAVQANDSRLDLKWIAGITAPANHSVLWIDTSLSSPAIKWFNGTAWDIAGGKIIIDDTATVGDKTYSSSKIVALLNSKAPISHTHSILDTHANSKENPHNVKASQITDLKDYIENNIAIASAITNKHTHSNKDVLDKLAIDSEDNLLFDGSAISIGDMKKSIYDATGSGIVNKAKVLTDGTTTFTIATINAMSNIAHKHDNANVLNEITEVFTTDMKTKLAGIATAANKYVHPTTHPATMIEQDISHRFVTDSEKLSYADKYTCSGVDNLLLSKEDKSSKGAPYGYAGLDATGKIDINQMPLNISEAKVVATIADRDLLNKYSGLRVIVADTSGDPSFGIGTAEFIWSGISWITINSTSQPGSVKSTNVFSLVAGTEGDRASKTQSDGTLFMTTDTKKIYLYFGGQCISYNAS